MIYVITFSREKKFIIFFMFPFLLNQESYYEERSQMDIEVAWKVGKLFRFHKFNNVYVF